MAVCIWSWWQRWSTSSRYSCCSRGSPPLNVTPPLGAPVGEVPLEDFHQIVNGQNTHTPLQTSRSTGIHTFNCLTFVADDPVDRRPAVRVKGDRAMGTGVDARLAALIPFAGSIRKHQVFFSASSSPDWHTICTAAGNRQRTHWFCSLGHHERSNFECRKSLPSILYSYCYSLHLPRFLTLSAADNARSRKNR